METGVVLASAARQAFSGQEAHKATVDSGRYGTGALGEYLDHHPAPGQESKPPLDASGLAEADRLEHVTIQKGGRRQVIRAWTVEPVESKGRRHRAEGVQQDCGVS